jgi:hypothetical protein
LLWILDELKSEPLQEQAEFQQTGVAPLLGLCPGVGQ